MTATTVDVQTILDANPADQFFLVTYRTHAYPGFHAVGGTVKVREAEITVECPVSGPEEGETVEYSFFPDDILALEPVDPA